MSSSNNFPSLSTVFDEQLDAYYKIENSSYPSNSSDYQILVADSIRKLEELTLLVSRIGVFSSNESFSELSTSSIKFLLLPVLLGSLTLKQVGSLPRYDVLKVASIYFKDFLNRCKEYELTNVEINKNEKVDDSEVEATFSKTVNSGSSRTGFPTPQELQGMALQRAEKIKRYKEARATTEKLKELKKALENPSCDEEVLRDYFSTMITHFIFTSLDELDAIILEQNMLVHLKTKGSDKESLDRKSLDRKPLRPFLITKDAAQKKVFGAGYPSLPVMSVDEFYEQRVHEDWFIAKSEAVLNENSDDASECQKKKEKKETDVESDEDVERQRQRDEWRDDHRRGWGNTYNRS